MRYRLRVCLGWILAIGVLLGWGNAAQAQEIDGPRYPELRAQIEALGALPVIVELDVKWEAAAFQGVDAVDAQSVRIATAQQEILAGLDATEIDNIKRYDYVPYLALTLNSAAALDALAGHPAVKRITADELVAPDLTESVEKVRAHHAHTLFYTGGGQTVAVLDTGVDKFHPKLQGRVVAEACFSTTLGSQNASSLCPGGASSSTVSNAALNCAANISGCDHGTHVAGIVNGVAPNANLIAVQVFSRITDGGNVTNCADANRTSPCTLAYTSDIISGLNYVLGRTGQFDIAAVNMSLGGGRFTAACDNDTRKPSIELLRGAGVATVISAGNAGFRDAMSAPACISAAISVAAADKNDGVASFSNINSRTTLFATGVNIYAAIPGVQEDFKSGTSMAAPHVAGAFAIFKQVAPTQSVEGLRNLLTATGPNISDNRSGGTITKRRLDVYTLLANLISIDADDFRTVSVPSSTNGTLDRAGDRDHYYLFAAAGSQVTVTMNRTSGTHDPYLELYDPTGTRIALNNNGGTGTNALLNGVILPQTGRYLLVARANNTSTGGYTLALSAQSVALNPRPEITRLAPSAVTGALGAADFWVRIDGRNFTQESRVYLNGSLRSIYYSSPNRVWIRMRGSDISLPWPSVKSVTVSNPAPGGGASAPRPLSITFPFLGTSELVQPQLDTSGATTIATGVETSFTISWTTPITIPSWRSMQFMDLRLRDDEGNVAAWVRVREQPGEESTFRLVNGAEVSVSTALTDTVGGPDEGLPGEDRTLEIPGYVTLNLATSSFSGSGQTAIMTPTLTFGPEAAGTYNIEFRVDGEEGAVQDDDILGRLTIAPAGCAAGVSGVTLSGPTTGTTDTDYTYAATVTPDDASGPLTYTWLPAPAGGQGTANAVYRWDAAGVKAVTVNVENCGGFGGATLPMAVRTTETPDLAIVKHGPAVAQAGEPITYTLRITNSGAVTATNLEITDVLPLGAAYQSGGTVTDDLVTWELTELGGYGATVEVNFVVTASATITNSIINVTADGDYSAFRTDPVVTEIVAAKAAVEPLADATLAYGTDATRTAAELPAGTVANPTTLALNEQAAPGRQLPAGMVYAGRAFALDAYVNNLRAPRLALNEEFSMTIGYDPAAVSVVQAAAGSAESEPTLVYWDGSNWVDSDVVCAPSTTPATLSCRLAAPLATEFALIVPSEASEAERIFLPVVKR